MKIYDNDTDYQALINQAVASGDYASAARYEQQRNAKIADLDAAGTNTYGAKPTNLYGQYAGGMMTQSPNFTGSSNGVYTFDATQGGIKDQMNQNSKLWWDAYNAGDTAWMQNLEAANRNLAAMLGDGVTFDSHTGYWTGLADQQMPVQAPVQMPTVQAPVVSLPTWSGGSGSMPTWEGTTASKPTWDGFDVAKPVYQSQRGDQIDALINQILNREKFSYDAETDPMYQQLRKQYTREGNRAMNDTMAAAAINAGGMNSYAMTAAQQANDYHMAQLADRIPELYQLAYSMYMDDLDLQRADLGMLQDMEAIDYNRFRDEVGDWYADRDFSYGQYRDQVGDWYADRNFDYGVHRDEVSDFFNNRDFEYGVHRDQVADSQWQTEFDYAVSRDQLEDQRYNQEWEYAVGRDQLADQRYDNETAYERAMDMLLQGIMPNDTLLGAAGISGNEAAAIRNGNVPVVKGSSGGGSGRGSGNTVDVDEPDDLDEPDDEPTESGELTVDAESVRKCGEILGYNLMDGDTLSMLEEKKMVESYEEDGKLKFRVTEFGMLPINTGILPKVGGVFSDLVMGNYFK